jgi:acetylornithine/N-succinyldiaminopimelate aminotransferase
MVNTISRWEQAILPSYATPVLTAVRGSGAVLWDDQGNSYLDLFAGIAVNVLGHAHPAIVHAVTEQVSTLGHVSNLVASEPAIQLAERLLSIAQCGPGKVFFANSGAEVNEAAIKIARRTGRREIIAAEGGFHGRTMGALSITGQPAKRAPFEPLLSDVTYLPYGDVDALRSAVNPNTAMVILEPIQGEGGVIVPPDGYLRAARDITQQAGVLLVLDEVQTGIARTGAWLACQHEGIRPDIITLAKGLGGGLPISACLAFGETASLLEPGQHGSTFGGNPVAAASALAVLSTIDSERLCSRTAELGEMLCDNIKSLNHPTIHGIRGKGLLLAIVLTQPLAATVERILRELGFLVNAVAADVIRIAPPLVITEEQLISFVKILPEALDTALTLD